MSLLLLVDNTLVGDLRLMTSIELFLRADYYCVHPCFCAIFDTRRNNPFQSVSSMVAMSVSFEAIDTNLFLGELIRAEAIANCKDKKWCEFMCFLALSTVTCRNIFSHYPDFDSYLLRWSLLFNQKIEPRPPVKPFSDDLRIVLCYEGVLPSSVIFKHNHYVPLICSAETRKRKSITSSLPKSKKKLQCSIKIVILVLYQN